MEVREIWEEKAKAKIGNRARDISNLAVEHGKFFLDEFEGDKSAIGIYGLPDCEALDLFEKELNAYFLGRGETVKIKQNSSVGYPIDVAFFLNAGRVDVNRDIEGFYN